MEGRIAPVCFVVKRQVGSVAYKLQRVLTAIQRSILSQVACTIDVEYAAVDVRENRHASTLHLLHCWAKVRARREIANRESK